MVQRVWQEIYDKDRDVVVAHNSKVKHNESTDEIDVPANFQALFKDKYSTPRYLTPRENHSRPRCNIIFNLQKDDKD